MVQILWPAVKNIRFPTNFYLLATRPAFASVSQSEVKDIGSERCFDWLLNKNRMENLGNFVEWECIDNRQQGRFWLRLPRRKWAHLVNPTIGNPLNAKASTWGAKKMGFCIYVIDYDGLKTGLPTSCSSSF